jgi:hypothetical protein
MSVEKPIVINDDNEDSDDERDSINYKDVKYILNNLDIAVKSCQDDNTFTIPSRSETSEIIVEQICYYVYLLLRSFILTRKMIVQPPSIVIFGEGFVGSKVIHRLVENK